MLCFEKLFTTNLWHVFVEILHPCSTKAPLSVTSFQLSLQQLELVGFIVTRVNDWNIRTESGKRGLR